MKRQFPNHEHACLEVEVKALKERVAALEQAQQLILQKVDERLRAITEHVKKFTG